MNSPGALQRTMREKEHNEEKKLEDSQFVSAAQMELIDPILPSTDRDVREGLRLLESPIVLFAETAAERRVRLRTLMIENGYATLDAIRAATGSMTAAAAAAAPRCVPVARAPRAREMFSPAPDALVRRRAELLPLTLSRAERRVAHLKNAFLASPAAVRPAHAAAIEPLRRLRLARSVRNVRTAPVGPVGGGALCLPFECCAAVPAVPHCAVTGAADGVATLWDTAACAPRGSAAISGSGSGSGSNGSNGSNGNGGGGLVGHCHRVRHIAAHPTDAVVFAAAMCDRRITAWRITGMDGAKEEEEEEEEEEKREKKENGDYAGEGALVFAGETDASGPFHAARVNRLAVDASGLFLASTSEDSTLCLWDIATLSQAGRLFHMHTQDGYEAVGGTLDVSFHPDGSLLSTTDRAGRVVTWDVRSGRHAFTAAGAFGGHLCACTCVAWSPCGVRFASGGADNVLHVWDARYLYRAATQQQQQQQQAPCILVGHTDVITSVSFFANPIFPVLPAAIASTSLDGTVRLWDAGAAGVCVAALEGPLPVRAQCRPCGDAPGTPGGALMTVAHGKYWSMWEAAMDGGPVEVICKETEATALTHRHVPFHTTSGGGGVVNNGDANDGGKYDDEIDDDEEDEEDEMAALRKEKTKKANPKTENDLVSSILGSSDDEDEMSFLKKKN